MTSSFTPDYTDSSAFSSNSPNWQAYLIRRHFLVWLRDHSSHWRATCRYNTNGTVYTNYLRGSFEDFDIVRVTPNVAHDCQKYELVNIRGNECENCTASTWRSLKDDLPLHIDSSSPGGCDFDGTQSSDDVGNEDNFGLYISYCKFEIPLYFKLRSNHSVLVLVASDFPNVEH